MRTPEPGAGFTLIELLAVILIVGILASLLVTQLGGAEEASRIQNTRRRLAVVEAAIDAYERDKGAHPSSTFDDESGLANDGTNVGAEALVLALWSEGWEGGGLLDDVADELVNTDGDAAPRSLSDFQTRELLEIPDDWGNPLAYLNRLDYDSPPRPYVTFDPETGEQVQSAAAAYKNPTTGRWYRHGSYQLVSAGPDGRFGSEDDLTSFERGS